MLGTIDPHACSPETGTFLLLALRVADDMEGHWAEIFPPGAVELKQQMLRATGKFFQSEPAALANLFEQRALMYYLTLAKGLVCQSAISGGGAPPAYWKPILSELDGLQAKCTHLEIANALPYKLSFRIPLSFFSGPDARVRRDFTEHVIEATAQEVRAMRKRISPTPFRLVTTCN
jgi:hypothetical protein